MKNLRKIAAAALTLALCASLACPVFASSYTVVKGDSLWKIAKQQLGSGTKWTELFEANRDIVQDPSKIQIGQVLTIPDGTEPAAPAQPETPAQPAEPAQPEPPAKPQQSYQLADASTPVNVDFSCVISPSGQVAWQAANTTFASLASQLSGSEYVGVEVLPPKGVHMMNVDTNKDGIPDTPPGLRLPVSRRPVGDVHHRGQRSGVVYRGARRKGPQRL